ncbi:MAG: hypothetical protein LRY39_01600 [Alphaproteobacteria bacterium]|nr:hypothetical protein [Alphaproteobacteria bacterium]MCD8571218.1 hypothetical protein [Alphaproteobacteria bacterium]
MTSLRQKLNRSASIDNIAFTIGDSHIGAINILKNIIKTKGENIGLELMLSLDDMNIRGAQIWVGLMHHCEGKLDRFIEKIQARDPDMVNTINEALGKEENAPKAVTFGASFMDPLPVWEPGNL